MAGVYRETSDEMDGYNYLGCQRPLPAFYWDERLTEMNCLRHAVRAVREDGYTHHIVRLMVLGNFALLAGVKPSAINSWFLEAYEDAHEWVVAPNVICMSQFADGGGVASKPYAASAGYIDRMSDYCGQCAYSPAGKTSGDACPFNYLYWAFVDRNRDRLASNYRAALAVRTLDRMDGGLLERYRERAASFLDQLQYSEYGR
jgi:deoxyribodipyrimidine photolyase-related protein